VLVVASLARFHFWDYPLPHPPRCPTVSGNTMLIQRITTILRITTIGRGMDSYHENTFSEKNPTVVDRLYPARLFCTGGFLDEFRPDS
jgi:hypothetical protein